MAPRTTEPPPEAVPLPDLCAGWEAQLLSVPPLTLDTARLGLRGAAWRALGAALAGDPAKAPAAALAALEALHAAEPAPEVSDAPVGLAEVAAAVRRAVRVGLASSDPKVVAAAVVLWRTEGELVDPDRVAGEGAAADAEVEALLRGAGARADAAAREMAAAGEVGR